VTINIVSKVYFINKKRKNKKEKERNKWWIGDIPILSSSLSPSFSIRYQGCIAPMIPTHPTMNKKEKKQAGVHQLSQSRG